MAKLKCLGSDSDGNGYLIITDSETLVLEAGASLSKLKEALNFNVSNVSAVLCSHGHLDHAKYLKDYVKIFRCFALEDTHNSLGITHHNSYSITPNKLYSEGGFKFVPFIVPHDVPTCAFVINHWQLGETLFVTDANEIPYTFNGLENLIIECNYSDELLNEQFYAGKVQGFLRERIMNSHLSLEKLKEFLLRTDLSKCRNIILIHLSSRNSHALNFKAEIEALTGKIVTIADKGIEIDLGGI